VRPLWHEIVTFARSKQWYAPDGKPGIADTLAGRFDAITLVLSLVLLRMEGRRKCGCLRCG
jgi:cytochrome b pre-mRNA-processing protein 3